MRTLEQLGAAVRCAWSAETSYWPETWTADNPAHGQCAVTALIVHDALGGEIMEGWVGGERHYWNRIEGRTVDLTWEQFPENARRVIGGPLQRVLLEANDSTRVRYALLTGRMTSLSVARFSASPPSSEGAGSRDENPRPGVLIL